MNMKIMYVIFYIGIAFAISIMIMEYFEIQQYMSVCRDYNNRNKDYNNVSFNITVGGLK